MPATNPDPAVRHEMRCCIAGGGPAGMVLGYLLARAGIGTTVLEKHSDFLRDFRGDTIHPSTLEVLHELGLLEEFLQRPHQKYTTTAGRIGDQVITMADFAHLPTRCRYLLFMPQWEFLDFLAGKAREFPGFELRMDTEASDLIEEHGRVTGIRAKTPQGPIEFRAGLVVAADGRHSQIRSRAKLTPEDFGAPMDVLWFRLPRLKNDPDQALYNFVGGKILILIDREEYWQCGFLIPKGAGEEIRQRGLQAFRDSIATIVPFVRERIDSLDSWDAIKLLTVTVNRLRQWYRPGLLCIGDAAHAMSPIGGVGINLAIQDAVATANLLIPALREGEVPTRDLCKVQRRREFPTAVTQRGQVMIQELVVRRALSSQESISVPLPLRLVDWVPALRSIPAYLVGVGLRPEHVRINEQLPVSTAITVETGSYR